MPLSLHLEFSWEKGALNLRRDLEGHYALFHFAAHTQMKALTCPLSECGQPGQLAFSRSADSYLWAVLSVALHEEPRNESTPAL